MNWKADTIDWDYVSNKTDPDMIFDGPMDSDDEVSLMGQEDMDMVYDVKSVIRDLLMIETPDVALITRYGPKGRYSSKVFGGIPIGPKTGTYILTMITENVMMILQWKRTLRKKTPRKRTSRRKTLRIGT